MKKRLLLGSIVAAMIAAVPAAFAAQDYAEVLNATPVYQQVQVVAPQQQCYQQRVVYDNGYGSNVAAGGLLGGVAGGVIGNQLGSGAGKALATVAGAVIGSVAGQQVAASSTPAPQQGYQTRCTIVNAVHYENRPNGYDVTYRYNGQVYRTHLSGDPGPRLLIQVDVQPAVY